MEAEEPDPYEGEEGANPFGSSKPPRAAPRSSRRRPSCSRCGGRPATQLRSTSTSISLRLGHGGQYAPLDRLANHAAVKHRTVCKLLAEARVHPREDLRAPVPISAQRAKTQSRGSAPFWPVTELQSRSPAPHCAPRRADQRALRTTSLTTRRNRRGQCFRAHLPSSP